MVSFLHAKEKDIESYNLLFTNVDIPSRISSEPKLLNNPRSLSAILRYVNKTAAQTSHVRLSQRNAEVGLFTKPSRLDYLFHVSLFSQILKLLPSINLSPIFKN